MALEDVTVPGARSEGGRISLSEIQSKKKTEQISRLSRYPDWHLKDPLPDGVTDVTGLARAALSPQEQEIVVQDAVSLQIAFTEGRYTAVEVAKAFFHAATVAHQVTNCLTEIFFDEGLARAEELDKYFKETGKLIGPLHGVPVSIKDHILVRGHDTSSGYAGWAFNTCADRDAVAVAVLRHAGAILYAKTANPQTLLSLETNNNVYGRTLNPFNLTLSPGGSSGGESALITLNGSVMGVGTDIGGSIRIPAAHCGLYGLKGSNARLPHAGLMGSHDGMDAIVGSLGPITRSARDLALFAKTMLDAEPWFIEPQILEIPWKQNLVEGQHAEKPLSIAILWDDGVVLPHPPITSALKDVETALLAAGHDVIRWEPMGDHQTAWDLITKLYFLDGGEEYHELLRDTNDPPVPQTKWMMTFAPDRPFTIAELWKLNLQREKFRSELIAHWVATKKRTKSGRPIDAILCPIAPTLAPPHDTTRWWGYSSYWNLADYPGVVFPVGRHTSAACHYPTMTHTPRNPIEKFIQEQWDPKMYDNAPVSLQLVARRLNEEKLLRTLNVVEEAIKHNRLSNGYSAK